VAAAVVAIASLAYGNGPIEITPGVPLTGLSGAIGSETDYKVVIPNGQGELEISISGGTGDCDLYVRHDGPPTYTTYDYRPFRYGNEETVTIDNPIGGNWYIMLRGRDAYSGVTLAASCTPAVPTELYNGVPETGISGGHNSYKLYSIDVPAGQTRLDVASWGGTGDVDLYVKYGSAPGMFDFDGRSFGGGTYEHVHISDPAAGTWYIMLDAGSFHNVTLRATYSYSSGGGGGSCTTLHDEVPVTGLSGSLGSEDCYVIDVPWDQGGLMFQTYGGTGDCDMYIKQGTPPTTSDYDFRPVDGGNNESISIGDPQAGPWYVLLVADQAYSGVTLLADYYERDRPVEDVTRLTPGVPVTGLGGQTGTQQYFSIEVPDKIKTLEIKMSGGFGDADLYVRRGALPTGSDYDYRPNVTGNNEKVVVTEPAAGTWYIMIRSYHTYSGVTLVASFDSVTPEGVIALTNGVPVTGMAGDAGSEQFFKIEVPADQTQLEIAISDGTGDADLYVRLGDKPTTKDWDYRPYKLGNKETVTIDDPKAGTYFIMVRGYKSYAGLTLLATYGPQGEQVKALESCVPVTSLSGAKDSETFFKILVPADQALLRVEISGGIGDADLYVKKGEKPTAKSWDYCPFLHGNHEVVEVEDPAAATWYIMIRGYQAYSGLTLKACFHESKGDCDDCVIIIW
jgi:hypothetical protein